ncbi:MAG: hypothetical protein ACRDOO_21625 [Actinomadura sp.]
MVRFRWSKKTTWSGMIFADDASLDRWKQKLADAELTFVGKEKTGRNTYVTFTGNNAEKAKAFLRKEPVDDDFTYIVVETPDGIWGTDSNSIYLEKLRPWQLDTGDADCTGVISALIDGVHNLQLAARGVIDNYVVEVTCGGCGHEWIDGIRYRDVTLVRCPECTAANRVDSANIEVT